jgi:hypothetical protein
MNTSTKMLIQEMKNGVFETNGSQIGLSILTFKKLEGCINGSKKK